MSRFDAAIDRLHNRLFAQFGDEAVLRGAEPCTVVMTRNVQLIGEHGQVEQVVTTAAMLASMAPRKGDPLNVTTGVAAGAWMLDAPMSGADPSLPEWVVVERQA